MRLSAKIFGITSLITLIATSGLVLLEGSQRSAQLNASERHWHEVMLNNVSAGVADSIWRVNENFTYQVLTGLFKSESILEAVALDEDGAYFAGLKRDADDKLVPFTTKPTFASMLKRDPNEKDNKENGYEVLPDSRVRVIHPLWLDQTDVAGRPQRSFVGFIVVHYSNSLVETLVRETLVRLVTVSIGFLVILSALIFFYLQRSVVRPVLNLVDASTKVAAGDFQHGVQAKSNDEIGDLERNFDNMRLKVKGFTENLQKMVDERTVEVTARKEKIQDILNNIEEGILTIDRTLSIDEEFSPFLARLYQVNEQDIPGRDVLDFVFPPSGTLSKNDVDQMRQALILAIGETMFHWDLNNHLMVRESSIWIHGEAKTLAFEWIPVLDKHDHSIKKMMVSIRDLTFQRNLEEQFAREKRHLRIISQLIAQEHQAIETSFRDIRKRLAIVNDLSDQPAANRDVLMVHLHTIKGTSRTLGYKDFVDVVHDTESLFQASATNTVPLKPTFDSHLKQVNELFHAYEDVFQRVLGGRKRANPAAVTAKAMIQGIVAEFRENLFKAGFSDVLVEIDDTIGTWNQENFSSLREILAHALTNVADHGYILPRQRANAVAKTEAKVEVQFRMDEGAGEFCMVIRDYGAGIDFGRLRAKVNNPRMSEAELMAKIFENGFSTSEVITKTSGRGAGLAAVKAIVEEHNGQVDVKSRDDGCTMTVKLPFLPFAA